MRWSTYGHVAAREVSAIRSPKVQYRCLAGKVPLDYRGVLSYSYIGYRGECHLSKPSDLIQGTLDLLLHKPLALESLHGWAISIRLRQVSRDLRQVSDGALYPALHELEQQGWIQSEWKPAENNRQAKFYRPERKQLGEGSANWRLSSAISHIVSLEEA
jgi:PadR family transcriptional regulator PadR